MNQTKSHMSEVIRSKSLAPGPDINGNYEQLLLEGQCAGITHVPTL